MWGQAAEVLQLCVARFVASRPASFLSLPAVGVACLLSLSRGMVDAAGKPFLSYPYAEDGLAIWRAMEAYFGDYLALYYGSGAEGDSKVAADEELQAFWKDVTVSGRRCMAEE